MRCIPPGFPVHGYASARHANQDARSGRERSMDCPRTDLSFVTSTALARLNAQIQSHRSSGLNGGNRIGCGKGILQTYFQRFLEAIAFSTIIALCSALAEF